MPRQGKTLSPGCRGADRPNSNRCVPKTEHPFPLIRRSLKFSIQISACALILWALEPLSLFAQSNQTVQLAPENTRLTPRPSFVNTADPALPGAEEVIVDVPSVFHWARFQRGEINGWRYTLYPDGSATVVSADNLLANPITLDCQSGIACKIARPDGSGRSVAAVGAPRPDAPQKPDGNAVAQYLAEWVLAGTGFSPEVVSLPNPKLPALTLTAPKPKKADVLAASAASSEAGILSEPLEGLTPEQESVAAAEAFEAETIEPEGPAPLCAEPDPIMPSLCLDPPAEVTAARAATPESAPPPRAASIGDNGPKPGNTASLKQQAASTSRITPAPKTVLGRLGLDCSITGSTSLGFVSKGSSAGSIGKPRLSLGCNSKLTEKLSLRFAVLKYINAGEQTVDDPDFTYAFTYRYSDKLTFNYSNYSGQFGGAKGGIWNALNDGTLRGSYKLPVIKLPNGKQTACSTSAKLPNPFDNSLNISCGYAVTDKLRIGGTLNLYMPHKQGDFDPDYTYTASYRVSKDLLISYSNYSNNRWAWNRGKNPGPGLTGGSLSFTYGLKF